MGGTPISIERMKRNYQKELDKIMETLKEQETKTLFLHSCCAPCSSYVLEYLSKYFDIVVFFYNPNISFREEYQNRIEELKRLITLNKENYKNKIILIEGDYEPERFYEIAKGMEHLPERGQRCYRCYELRMKETARLASKYGADYFTSTLSISPHKNAVWINEIGEKLSKKYGVAHLPSDFKKKNGYKRSIELSNEYDLYRQDYCGCIYSKMERERQKQEEKQNMKE